MKQTSEGKGTLGAGEMFVGWLRREPELPSTKQGRRVRRTQRVWEAQGRGNPVSSEAGGCRGAGRPISLETCTGRCLVCARWWS